MDTPKIYGTGVRGFYDPGLNRQDKLPPKIKPAKAEIKDSGKLNQTREHSKLASMLGDLENSLKIGKGAPGGSNHSEISSLKDAVGEIKGLGADLLSATKGISAATLSDLFKDEK